jgi:hypothetical protein
MHAVNGESSVSGGLRARSRCDTWLHLVEALYPSITLNLENVVNHVLLDTWPHVVDTPIRLYEQPRG